MGRLQDLCGTAVWSQWSAGKGDVSGFFQLFFDNVATTLTLTFLTSKFGLGLLADKEIYNGFLPGLGISMVFGNVYYAWMACRLSAAEGRSDVTANPYGINTHGAFAYLFGVLLPVALSTVCPPELDPSSDKCAAWRSEETLRVGVSANFFQALIATLLGFIAPYIHRVCPVASLVSALGGIGISFLGIGQFLYAFEQPLVGLVPAFLMLMIYFGSLKTGYVPEALVVALVGTILGWADGVTTGADVKASLDVIGWHPPMLLLGGIFQAVPSLAPYWGTIIPVAVTSAASTLMCWQTAAKNGDVFPLRETMFVDGSGSLIAAMFGCPFGTAVYIGHTAYKKVGAKSGYSLFNAIAYIILTMFGLFTLVEALIPIEAVAPIILFVGLMIATDAFESVPFRHIPAVVLGFMPSIGDWAVNQCSAETDSGEPCFANTAPLSAGLAAFKYGALLVAMVISAMFANICDRKYLQVAMWSAAGAVLSLFGVIHAPAAGVNFDNGTPQAQWRFFVGYAMVSAVALIISAVQKFCPSLVEAPITDEKDYLSVLQLVQIAFASAPEVDEAVKDALDDGPAWHADSQDSTVSAFGRAAEKELQLSKGITDKDDTKV